MVTISSILSSLDLEQVGPHQYIGSNIASGHDVVFGGQLLAQSIVASLRDHEEKSVKTLQTVFPRSASASAPLEISVVSLQSGRSIASSSVSIRQGDRLCAHSTVLMSADEPDLIRYADGPTHTSDKGNREELDSDDWMIEVEGEVDVNDPDAVGPPELDVWTRFPRAPDTLGVSQALLAYATDGFLIGTAMRPHRGIGQAQAHVTLSTGVLGHTLTFHEPFFAGDWLLMSHRSPYAGRGRSYGRADVFTSSGQLVASFVQDSMIRAMPTRPAGASSVL
jgi:acyl-CoA thioesterase II